MLSYMFAKNQIEDLHSTVVNYQNTNAVKKAYFAQRVKNDGAVLQEFMRLIPVSLRMEAKRAIRRADEALNATQNING